MKLPKIDPRTALTSVALGGGLVTPLVDKILTGGKVSDKVMGSIAQADPLKGTYEERHKAQAEADKSVQQGAGRFGDIALPDTAMQYATPEELTMDQLELSGYDPRLMEASAQGASKFGDISTDPRFAEAQLQALGGVQDIVSGGGLTAQDQANLAQIQSDVGRADRGRREAIQDRMRRTGMSGSGMDLLAQLQSGQAATDRASQAGLNIAGMAQDRQAQALRDLGAMGGQMRGQDFSEQAAAAQAQDAINRFNTMNQQQAAMQNMAAQNQAAQFGAQAQNQAAQSNWQGKRDTDLFNLQNRQNVAQANVDKRNQANQDWFDNSMRLASAKSNADLGLGSYQQGKADRANQRIGQVAQGVGQLAGAGASALFGGHGTRSDENEKTQIEPIGEAELSEFLEAVKPRKFKYKDQARDGQGQRVGFMAQDIEPTSVGSNMVVDTPEGKMIDNNNLMGAILDSLSMVHKKQKKLEDDEPVMIMGGS